MKKLALALVITALMIPHVSAQQIGQRLQSAIDEVNSALKVRDFAGGKFALEALVDIDSGRCVGCFDINQIETHHSALRGCYIFIVQGRDSTGMQALEKARGGGDSLDVLGVFKDHSILWLSEPMTGFYEAANFFAVSDINNDGNVEIVLDWRSGNRLESSSTWIFSWDGTRGVPINETEDGYSVIDDAYAIKDIDGDGVKEVLGSQCNSDDAKEPTDIVYSWNGSKYGLWPSTPKIGDRKFTVANNLTASVRAEVQIESGKKVFLYSLHNDAGSKQSIRIFFVPDRVDTVWRATPIGWRVGRMPHRSFIDLVSTSDQYDVKPGESKSNLGIISKGLPCLVTYYIQGPFSPLSTGEFPPTGLTQKIIDNVYQNSVRGSTIAPSDPESPFVPSVFLDTLHAYNIQSRSLDWIKDQATADKYLGYFSAAKAQLEQNNTTGTRTTLQSVLRDVDVDSSSTLTSEAYALLRYNTEYLLDQLPTPQELSIDDLIALKHEAEDKSWIGDENFVKELDNGLDNAKKHLARGDSVNCAKELEKFQEKVKKEHDRTLEEQRKHKPRDKRFVTEEGYQLLSTGAQKIIDRLAEKK